VDWLVIPGGIALIVILVGLLARSRARAESAKNRRGTDPGEGDQLIDSGYYAGGLGGGHGGVIRVTRDPQQYAKGFVPSGKRRPRDRVKACRDDQDGGRSARGRHDEDDQTDNRE